VDNANKLTLSCRFIPVFGKPQNLFHAVVQVRSFANVFPHYALIP